MTPPVSKGLSRKKKHGIKYPNIPSAIRPVPLGEILPFPKAPEKYTLDSDNKKLKVLQIVVNSQCHRRNRALHRVFLMNHILYLKMN